MNKKRKLIIIGTINIVCFIGALIIALMWGDIIPINKVTNALIFCGGVLLLAAIVTLVIFIIVLLKKQKKK